MNTLSSLLSRSIAALSLLTLTGCLRFTASIYDDASGARETKISGTAVFSGAGARQHLAAGQSTSIQHLDLAGLQGQVQASNTLAIVAAIVHAAITATKGP